MLSVNTPQNTLLCPRMETTQEFLYVFFQDFCGVRAPVYCVTYSLYFVSFGLESLIGTPQRSPLNPEPGVYYAHLFVPKEAMPGEYIIRWFFKEAADSVLQESITEFTVLSHWRTLWN
jgi:hypothetical protein